MKKLLIENAGHMELAALTSLGASTKRGDNSKIGLFGSGNQYAMSNALRHKIGLNIFSGTDEMILHTKPVRLKELSFEQILITYQGNTENTGITTSAGPQWEPWFVIREFYSNALDEGDAVIRAIDTDNEPMAGVKGKTRIYLEFTPEIMKVYNHWNAYFIKDRLDLIEELKDTGIRLYSKYDDKMRIYRKGILVYTADDRTSLFDYDVDQAEIDESRVLRSEWSLKWDLENAISRHGSKRLILTLLRDLDHAERNHKTLFESGFDFGRRCESNKENWIAATEGLLIINSERKDIFIDEMREPNSLLIPGELARALANLDNANVIGVPRKGLAHGYKESLMSASDGQMLNKALEFLTLAGFDFGDMPITRVTFDDYKIMGMANILTKNIYLGQSAFDKGIKQIVATLIEEHSHIISRSNDGSRAFQDFLLDNWLNEVQERLGIIL